MPVTYSGDPEDSDLDAVRFLIGDTSTSAGKLQDAEIEWLLTQYTNVYKAASVAAIGLYTRFAGLANSITVGPLSKSYSNQAQNYMDLSKRLENEYKNGSQSAILVYSGGISQADKLEQQGDLDYDQPWFKRGFMDYPGTSDGDSIVSAST